MKFRTILAVAAAATAVLPAAAGAAGSVSGGPVKVAGGYTVMLHATDAKKDQLLIMIDRGTASRNQSDTLMFTTGVRVTVRGGSASIKGSLGSHGRVDLRMQNARKDSGRKLREGCTGTPKATYSGRLVGTLRLRLPNGKTATIRSLPASTSSGGGDVKCHDTDPRKGGDGEGGDGEGQDDQPRLLLSSQSDGTTFTFVATKGELTLTRSAAPQKQRGTTVTAMTTVRASGSNLLQPADGGATAGVKSAGAFTGNGAYRSSVGPGPMTTGPLVGSLRVKLQGAPLVTIAGENAMLMNGDK
ncbi:MAG: hypothetical protein ITG02_05600 [Patulibacter sp.]|nr:hypothetical protein [Patulibacter sp.]